MFNTLLLDLDGTLLELNLDVFIPKYVGALSKRVSHVVDPMSFGEKLLEATYAMIRNLDASKTNKEVFMEEFFARVDATPAALVPIFDEFYSEDFPKLIGYSKCRPEARGLIQEAINRDIDVVIATNPVFPMAAISERLRWAGIEDFEYSLVTTYENMHFCKPNPEYFQETLDMLDKSPDECLVVGNDPHEDLSASELGIKTFLVNDPYMSAKKDSKYQPDYEGELSDVLQVLKQ